jgi:hypothetical protein
MRCRPTLCEARDQRSGIHNSVRSARIQTWTVWQGSIGCYRHALTRVQPTGPLLLDGIIRAAAFAQQSWASGHIYSVLLIMAHGRITKPVTTREALKAASQSALSVIIVGVGESYFWAMESLDRDDLDGRDPSRDICQFVAFRDWAANPARLSAEVLARLPPAGARVLLQGRLCSAVRVIVGRGRRSGAPGSRWVGGVLDPGPGANGADGGAGGAGTGRGSPRC